VRVEKHKWRALFLVGDGRSDFYLQGCNVESGVFFDVFVVLEVDGFTPPLSWFMFSYGLGGFLSLFSVSCCRDLRIHVLFFVCIPHFGFFGSGTPKLCLPFF